MLETMIQNRSCLKTMRRQFTGAIRSALVGMVMSSAMLGGTVAAVAQDNATESPVIGGTLRFSAAASPSGLDPQRGTSGSDHQFLYPVFDTLITMDPATGEARPGLAESWTLTRKYLELKLRQGVLFQDGTPFDAKAVAFNFDRAKNYKSSNLKADVSAVESVDVVDDHTVKINLNRPASGLLLTLADRAGMMISPTAAEQSGDDFALHPVGAGPFKFVEWRTNEVITYERFPDYWQKGKPYLDGLQMFTQDNRDTALNAFEAGEIDMLDYFPARALDRVGDMEGVTVKVAPSLRAPHIWMNMSTPPFDNKLVRQALNYAIDRETINNIMQRNSGEPSWTLIPSMHWAFPKSIVPTYTFDPAKAKELLAQAGFPTGFKAEMGSASDADNVRLAQLVQGNLKDIGVDVTITTGPLQQISGVFFTDKKFPMFMSAWTGRPDPSLSYDLMFDAKSYFNVGRVEVPGFAAAMDKVHAASSQDEVAAGITEAAATVAEDAPYIPLYFQNYVAAYHQNVHGFQPTLLGKANLTSVWLAAE